LFQPYVEGRSTSIHEGKYLYINFSHCMSNSPKILQNLQESHCIGSIFPLQNEATNTGNDSIVNHQSQQQYENETFVGCIVFCNSDIHLNVKYQTGHSKQTQHTARSRCNSQLHSKKGHQNFKCSTITHQ
jgi:hypothetical protein